MNDVYVSIDPEPVVVSPVTVGEVVEEDSACCCLCEVCACLCYMVQATLVLFFGRYQND
jgi:hypothetical protein